MWSCGVMLFILAVGAPPFTLPSVDEAAFVLVHTRQVRKVVDAYTGWSQRHVYRQAPIAGDRQPRRAFPFRVSDALVDLLNGMMAPQGERITVPEILAHAWLRDCDDIDDVAALRADAANDVFATSSSAAIAAAVVHAHAGAPTRGASVQDMEFADVRSSSQNAATVLPMAAVVTIDESRDSFTSTEALVSPHAVCAAAAEHQALFARQQQLQQRRQAWFDLVWRASSADRQRRTALPVAVPAAIVVACAVDTRFETRQSMANEQQHKVERTRTRAQRRAAAQAAQIAAENMHAVPLPPPTEADLSIYRSAVAFGVLGMQSAHRASHWANECAAFARAIAEHARHRCVASVAAVLAALRMPPVRM